MIFFIPARSGSERVIRKNMRLVCNKPLISWTFDRVRQVASEIDKVIVSSDDQDILELAKSCGFVYTKRDPSLCTREAKMSDVLSDAIKQFGTEDVCILYPTSPLRTATHIRSALSIWQAKGGSDKTLMSVTPVYHRPYGLMKVTASGFLYCNDPQGERFYQSQNMPTDYRANGAIYVIPTGMIARINSQLFCDKTIPFFMDELSSLEIDTESDFSMVEPILKNRCLTEPGGL